MSEKIKIFSLTNNIGVASAITFVFQLLQIVFAFAASIILARSLGPEGRGSYAIIMIVSLILGKLGTFGLEISNIYFSAKRTHPINILITNSIIQGLITGTVLSLLTFIVINIPFIKIYLQKNLVSQNVLILAILVLPINIITIELIGILQGRERVYEFNLVTFSIIGIQTILQFLLLSVLKTGVDGAVWSVVISSVFGFLICLWFTRKLTEQSFSFDRVVLRESMAYAIKAYLANMAQFLNYRLDQIIVSIVLGTKSVGYYAVAVSLVERIWLIPQSISIILFPRTSSTSTVDANILTPKIARNSLYLLIIITSLFAIIAKPMIKLIYGTEFSNSTTSVLFLLPGVVVLGYGKIFMGDLLGRGRPDIGLIASTISLVATIILDILLIPLFGIIGAAVASTIAYLISATLIYISFLNISKVRVLETVWLQRGDVDAYRKLINLKVPTTMK